MRVYLPRARRSSLRLFRAFDFRAGRLLTGFSFALTLAALASGCGARRHPAADRQTPTASPTHGTGQEKAAGLVVVDLAGAPIAGAKVLIGTASGVPFAGNFVATGADGSIPVPAGWSSPLPVTIDAPGFVRATYYGRTPSSGPMALRRGTSAQPVQLTGVTTGYGAIPNDGWVRVGLVFPAPTRAEIGAFQISTFISPERDAMTVAGRTAELPSNVSVPRQRHTYVVPVTLEKPVYRAFFEREGSYRVVAAHARFRLSDAAGAIQAGKPFSEIVDLIEFKEASLQDLSIPAAGARVDLDVRSISFTSRTQVSSPRYGSQFTAFALALNELNGRLYPSDVKKIASGASKQLVYPACGAQCLAALVLQPTNTAAVGAASDQGSIIVGAAAQIGSSEFAAIPTAPAVRGGAPSPSGLVLSPPPLPRGTDAVATFATLSSVARAGAGSAQTERKAGRWDLYAEGWANALDLPEWPIAEPAPTGTQRWEAGFVASPAGVGGGVGSAAFERASHVAKSAVDF